MTSKNLSIHFTANATLLTGNRENFSVQSQGILTVQVKSILQFVWKNKSSTWYGLGLYIKAFLNQEDYMPTSATAGLKLIIQGQNDAILPDVTGQLAAAGHYTSFAIQKVVLF